MLSVVFIVIYQNAVSELKEVYVVKLIASLASEPSANSDWNTKDIEGEALDEAPKEDGEAAPPEELLEVGSITVRRGGSNKRTPTQTKLELEIDVSDDESIDISIQCHQSLEDLEVEVRTNNEASCLIVCKHERYEWEGKIQFWVEVKKAKWAWIREIHYFRTKNGGA